MSEAGVVITVLDNGPYLVKGTAGLVDVEGDRWDTAERPSIALCRCGASLNKPFCDGSHARLEFEAVNRAKGPGRR